MATISLPEGVEDDKAQYVIPFILDLLHDHEQAHADTDLIPPLIVGLSAPQGAGKSVLVSLLHHALTSEHDIPTSIFSIDDFYLPHKGLEAVAQANPTNPLLQHRGQPSTHDVPLIRKVFQALKQNKPTRIPQFDKSAYNGYGDRVSEDEWLEVNTDLERPIRVVLFEGWCVGFRALSERDLERQHEYACEMLRSPDAVYHGRLGHVGLEDVRTVNRALAEYDEMTALFDGLVHLDASEPLWVYEWRQEQEHNLIRAKGNGMTDQQVKVFIDGYFPSYELYVPGLTAGVFGSLHRDGLKNRHNARQLRLQIGRDRKIVRAEQV